jgi:hypothetical protein
MRASATDASDLALNGCVAGRDAAAAARWPALGAALGSLERANRADLIAFGSSLRLRGHDIDFARNETTVRDGKGTQGRTMFSSPSRSPCRSIHERSRQSAGMTSRRTGGGFNCRRPSTASPPKPRRLQLLSEIYRRTRGAPKECIRPGPGIKRENYKFRGKAASDFVDQA